MLFTFIVHHYLLWHYTNALGEIAHVAKNFLWFIIHFFSIPSLLRSLFAPWKRITEERGEGFSFESLASYFIINLLSRLVGFLVRLSIILIGLFFITTLLTLVFFTYIFWVFAPALLLVSLLYGLVLIFA